MATNNKVFITGITGFVGQNLGVYLAKDFNVKGISRQQSALSITYNSYFENRQEAVALVHLAGKAHDLKKTSNDDDFSEINTELTKTLFKHFLKSDCPVFIYMSSVKAAADEVKGILTEDVLPNPVTAYGKSKQMAEAYLLANLHANKKIYILRPCLIHGPGNKGNLNLLYKLVSKNAPWPLGAFENRRSFCSIDNLMFVFKELIQRDDIPSGIYNVADDEPLSTNEVISILAESQNKNPKIWNVSKKFIEGVASIGDKLHLPLNTERLHKLTSSYVVSNAKIKAAIWKPLPVSSREGLLRTFKSFNSK